MLRITQSKSAQQAKSYYVSGLSREDYYSEGQEIAGNWQGKGAERKIIAILQALVRTGVASTVDGGKSFLVRRIA